MASQNPTIEDRASNSRNIKAFYKLKPEYIEGTKKAIEMNYGGFDTYFESIGVVKSEIQSIKSILLTE